MFALPEPSVSHPVAVLLGGAGRVHAASRRPTVPALLKPPRAAPGRSGRTSELHPAGG